jgi:WD40 repeat protein
MSVFLALALNVESLRADDERLPILNLAGHQVAATGLLLTPDGRTMLTLDQDGSLRGWDVDTGKQTFVLWLTPHIQAMGAGSTPAVISADGKLLVLGYIDYTALKRSNRLCLLPLDDRRGTYRVLGGHDRGTTAVAFAPDGSRLASAGYDQAVRVWFGHDIDSSVPSAGRHSLEREQRLVHGKVAKWRMF